jgi:hypothetical protein
MVSKDSRIDQYPRLVKGESKVVWEWQGKQQASSWIFLNMDEISVLLFVVLTCLTFFICI